MSWLMKPGPSFAQKFQSCINVFINQLSHECRISIPINSFTHTKSLGLYEKMGSGGDATLGWLLLVVFAFSLVCYDFGIEFAPIWDNTGTKFIYKEKSLGAYFIYLFIYFGGGFINN